MSKLREKITVANLYLISEFFETMEVQEFQEGIASIYNYLQEGYKYASNVKEPGMRQMGIREYLDILDTLKICADAMSTTEESRHCRVSLSKSHSINLEPFIDFLQVMEEQSYKYSDLERINEAMKNYLNASNIADYKKGSSLISDLAGTIKYLYLEMEKAA